LIINKLSIEIITYKYFQRSQAFLEQGDRCFEKENFTEAIKFYKQALSLNSQFSLAWNHQAYALEKLNLNEEAITCFDRAIAIDNNILALQNKVESLQKLGEDEQAIIICDRLLNIEPDNYQFWMDKAISLGNLKQSEKLL
jgi:tetratricopeptide (TPR) repeat protein